MLWYGTELEIIVTISGSKEAYNRINDKASDKHVRLMQLDLDIQYAI